MDSNTLLYVVLLLMLSCLGMSLRMMLMKKKTDPSKRSREKQADLGVTRLQPDKSTTDKFNNQKIP